MSERLKRRKKGASRPSQEKAAAPEPLQPKYFEDIPETPVRKVVETAPAAEMDEARRERGREPQRARVREPELEQKTRAKSLTQPETLAASKPQTQPALQAQPEAQAQPELHAQPAQEGKLEIEPAAALAHEPNVSTQPSLRPTRRRRRRGGRGGARRAAVQAATQAPGAPASIAPVSAATTEVASPLQVAAPPEVETLATEPVAAELPPTAPTPAPQRASKGIVVLAIGLPGSGKTTWFKRHEIRPLSSDMMRTLLFDDVHEQRFQDLVFSNLRSMLKARLIARRPTNYVDATNLTPQERHHWIKLAKDFGYEVHAVFFDVPLEVCIERHQRRDRVVPEDVMRRMSAKLKPPTFEEGFAKITVVRVKKKDAAAS